ncbi:MAG: helix-turn-helix transcriptional regulator [Chloroflexi bacterium]|nr:helix-turn-helix transcriptional regulator [Chloroflexota bacterium]
MNTFGETLRAFRQTSNDPDRSQKRLSQERLGELMGRAMGDFGFSGAAVSDWERGKSRISVQDRNVLTALIQVLHQCGGIRTPAEANRLLEAGNYKALDTAEMQKIFGGMTEEKKDLRPSAGEYGNTQSSALLLLTDFFSIPRKELQRLIVQVEDGPSPVWPRVLAALMRWVMDHASISTGAIFWIWIWLGTWWLMGPSLRWPFIDHESAVRAVIMFIGGTLTAPLCIGLLVKTRENEYWKQQNGVNLCLLRLYTYQGAGIGFNLGYFFIFPLVLIRYHLQLESTIWIEFIAATLSLFLGNMAARVVPYNLWRAYGRLSLKDGGIFFVVALLGPLWGFFFLEFYAILVTPVLGWLVILLAVMLLVAAGTGRKKESTH